MELIAPPPGGESLSHWKTSRGRPLTAAAFSADGTVGLVAAWPNDARGGVYLIDVTQGRTTKKLPLTERSESRWRWASRYPRESPSKKIFS